jgi:hypothetical protein
MTRLGFTLVSVAAMPILMLGTPSALSADITLVDDATNYVSLERGIQNDGCRGSPSYYNVDIESSHRSKRIRATVRYREANGSNQTKVVIVPPGGNVTDILYCAWLNTTHISGAEYVN